MYTGTVAAPQLPVCRPCLIGFPCTGSLVWFVLISCYTMQALGTDLVMASWPEGKRFSRPPGTCSISHVRSAAVSPSRHAGSGRQGSGPVSWSRVYTETGISATQGSGLQGSGLLSSGTVAPAAVAQATVRSAVLTHAGSGRQGSGPVSCSGMYTETGSGLNPTISATRTLPGAELSLGTKQSGAFFVPNILDSEI
jgi:hypothetical protein